jgi:hypothetical protein
MSGQIFQTILKKSQKNQKISFKGRNKKLIKTSFLSTSSNLKNLWQRLSFILLLTLGRVIVTIIQFPFHKTKLGNLGKNVVLILCS